MKKHIRVVVMLVLLVQGCAHFSDKNEAYREVWLENAHDVKITSVVIGRAGDGHSSNFGVLGSKGAGATAGVPVRYESHFPIQWEEKFDGKQRHAVVDLREFAGVKNRAIILSYQGHGVWVAKTGRQIRPE